MADDIQSPDEHPLVSYAAKRFEREKLRWQTWTGLWSEAYEYALPQRDKFYASASHNEGDRRGVELYDQTAVVSTTEFASRLHAGIMPPFVRWADLLPGSQIPAGLRPNLQRQLEEIVELIFEVLRDSNLDSQIHECFLDLAVGHATLLVEEGLDKPIDFLAVPMTHNIWGMGPKGHPDANFRPEELTAEQILVRYPRAAQHRDLADKLSGQPEEKLEIVHASWRDWRVREDEVHHYL